MTTISSYTTQSGVIQSPIPQTRRLANRQARVQTQTRRRAMGRRTCLFLRQIPNRWNLADSRPLSSVRRRFGQTNFGVSFGVGSE